MKAPRHLFSGYRKHWAHRFGVAPVLPTTRDEMDALGWDSCDVVLVTGDAYVDHPSFGMALVGRLLEAHGFRVGIVAQPPWTDPSAFMALGRPNLMFGITAGNMDSMVNRYTSDRKIRRDDAYSPDAAPGLRPDRAVLVYAQRCREAYTGVPIVIGGIEASLRRIAHYDYWSDKVRRSVLLDARADLLVYGSGERAVVEIAQRLGRGEDIRAIDDLRGTAFIRKGRPEGFFEIDSTEVDTPGPVTPPADPYAMEPERAQAACSTGQTAAASPGEAASPGAPSKGGGRGTGAGLVTLRRRPPKGHPRERTVIRLPAYEQVRGDSVLYAHASRILHAESNPHNARCLVQRHGNRDVWINPPPIPLSTDEMDRVFELPYTRVPHPRYGDARLPAYEMIRFSVTITRGCFGGCSFCSITEHEGRIIQNRSERSILAEIERIRDTTPGFTGVISDLGGPTANMWRLACKSREIEAACRKPSCIFPDVCGNLGTDHSPLIGLYRKARALPGIKKILIASGLRYDLAVRSPAYVKELATHHVGGYLKIAPEHVARGPLDAMMKPGIGTYDRFKTLFDRYSKQAGKEQYLIPYFIAAHPGTTDEDMLELALWLKNNGFRPDAVQAFLPSPMASATAMYHSGKNSLRRVRRSDPEIPIPRGLKVRRLHKAFLRYHDANNWPLLREALRRMGREDLIGNGQAAPGAHLAARRDRRRARGASATAPGAASHRGAGSQGRRAHAAHRAAAAAGRRGRARAGAKERQEQAGVGTGPRPSALMARPSPHEVQSMPAQLRRAGPGDVDTLVELDRRADAEHGEGFAASWSEGERVAYRRRIAAFAEPTRVDAVAWVADWTGDEGRSSRGVGAILAHPVRLGQQARSNEPHVLSDPPYRGLVPADGRFIEVFQLWVEPAFRRRGLGLKLKRTLEDHAARREIGLIYTHVRADNGPAIMLNHRLGYREIFRGPLWDEVVRVGLIKRVSPVVA